jgi:hypothetical protein
MLRAFMLANPLTHKDGYLAFRGPALAQLWNARTTFTTIIAA